MTNKINRREFLKASSVAALGFTIIPSLLKAAPSDKVRVAHIGVGNMGNSHMNWFARLPEVDIVALCDVDEDHVNGTLKKLQEINPDAKPQLYGDFRKILERKDVDAVTIATPDHWHAPIATLAFQAGKDVYGEKPLSYCVREGQVMLKNLNRYDRVFQLGTQIHAGDNYHRAVEIIQSGMIGKVHTVRLWKTGFSPGLGRPAVTAPPKNLNWDMWLGPAPYAEYFPERCHFTYRYFLDYSGGVFADFWCHIADVVWWAIRPTGLTSVVSRGEKTDGIADAPKWLDTDMEFKDLKLYWTSQIPDVPGAGDKHIGAFFEGDKGTVLVDCNTTQVRIDGKVVEDLNNVPVTIVRSPGHQQNFIDAVKSRKMPESNLAYAREMTLPMHLALISWRLNRKLEWNPKKEKFRGDKEANALLNREPRKGWDLI